MKNILAPAPTSSGIMTTPDAHGTAVTSIPNAVIPTTASVYTTIFSIDLEKPLEENVFVLRAIITPRMMSPTNNTMTARTM